MNDGAGLPTPYGLRCRGPAMALSLTTVECALRVSGTRLNGPADNSRVAQTTFARAGRFYLLRRFVAFFLAAFFFFAGFRMALAAAFFFGLALAFALAVLSCKTVSPETGSVTP